MNKVKRKNGFTCLVKPFRSDSSQAKLTQPPAQSSQTKFRSCAAHSYGFTLAETMIVLVVLGVIAAITVPSLVRHQIDAANRAKIKKSMTIYDLALNKMVIENGIRGNNDLTTFAPLNNCTNTSTYFKAVENIDNNICKFKTSDGVWWDISDIQHPIIALDRDNLLAAKAADTNNNKAYYLVGRFDDNTGILRVDDLKYETNANNATEKGYLEKLYGFLNKQAQSGGGNQGGGEQAGGGNACAADDIRCLLTSSGGNVPDIPRCQNGVYVSCADFEYEEFDGAEAYIYDADGNYAGNYTLSLNETTGQFYKTHESIINADGSGTSTLWSKIWEGEHAGEVYKSEETINNADGSWTSTLWGVISTGEHAGEVYKSYESTANADYSEYCSTQYDEGGNITEQNGNACN